MTRFSWRRFLDNSRHLDRAMPGKVRDRPTLERGPIKKCARDGGGGGGGGPDRGGGRRGHRATG